MKSMVKPTPLLSILVPSYNDRTYVGQCITSLLDSNRTDFEIIISDDCSDKETLEILDQFSDDRLTLVKSDVRLGAINNWKKCLSMAQGRWVHFVASDDYYAENTVDSILDNLKEKDTVYLIAHQCFEDGSDDVFEAQCTPNKVNKIFEFQVVVDWVRLLKFFNHDELVLSIFPRVVAKALFRLSQHSTKSSFMYWVLAIFYKAKVSFIEEGAVMKRYNHKVKRAQWGESKDNKSVLGFSLNGFLGDLYNSSILALHFRDFGMLLTLLFRNRFHGTKKGGFYGFFGKSGAYYYPGPIVQLFMGPLIIMARKLGLHKKIKD